MFGSQHWAQSIQLPYRKGFCFIDPENFKQQLGLGRENYHPCRNPLMKANQQDMTFLAQGTAQ
eukprot:3199856-Amphidinium_carterae.1